MTGEETEFPGVRKEVSSGPSYKRTSTAAGEVPGKCDSEVCVALPCSDGLGDSEYFIGRKWKGNYCSCVAVT